MIAFALMPLINRWRGGFGHWQAFGYDIPHFSKGWTRPGAALATGLVSLLYMAWPLALTIGVGYWVWALVAWGRWFDLNEMPDIDPIARPYEPFEEIIDNIAPEDYTAMLIRHTAFGTFPLSIGLAILTQNIWWVMVCFFMGIAIVVCYWIGKSVTNRSKYRTGYWHDHIFIAELLVGLVWAALIVGVGYYG